VRWGADVRKFASGYNIRDLWVGSEGTLGIITGAVLRLVPQPASRWTGLVAFPDEAAAVGAVRALLGRRLVPSVLEFLDRQTTLCTERYHGSPVLPEAGAGDQSPALLLIELDGHPAAVADERTIVAEVTRGAGATAFREADGDAGEALWHVRRTCSQAMFSLGPDKLNEDIVVPLRSQAALFELTLKLREETGLPTPTFGHAADGNFHVHFMYNGKNPEQLVQAERGVEKLMREVIRLGGAITGEHGVGLAKSPFLALQHNPAEINAMRTLKRALDPADILNPGKIFEPFRIWKHRPLEVRLPWDKRPKT
jgi:glycolate oxidase